MDPALSKGMDKRLILSLMTVLMFSACAPGGFQTTTDADPVAEGTLSSSSLTPATGDGAAAGKISSAQGELEWKTAEDAAKSLRYSYTLKIPFGKVYGTLSQLTHWMAPYACQWTSVVQSSSVHAYAPGEIPCGAVLNDTWKQVLVLDIDPMSGQASGVNYAVSGASVPVYLSRATFNGTYNEASLDAKKTVARTSSSKFAEDISLRYTPSGRATRLELCMNVPGASVTAPTTTIHASAWKKVLGVKIAEGSDFTINAGQAAYRYGRGCFAVDFGWALNATAPTVQLKNTVKPYLYSVNYSGLSVRIGDWFLRLIDNIMNAFNVSIKKSLIKKATQKVNDLADSEIESGAWFARVHGEDLLDKTSRKINQRFAKALSRAGIPASTSDLRAMIHDSCRLKKLSLSQDWTQRLETFCQTIVDKTHLEITPFAVDAASKSLGCYDYFARIHDVKDSAGKKKWWADNCRFATSFTITLPTEFTPYRKELEQLVGDLVSDKKIPQEWKDIFEELDIDEYLLKLVLEEIQNRGINQIHSGDWRSNLAGIVEQIRARIANASE